MINNLSMRKFKCIISISLGTYVHIKFTKRKWQHLQLTQTMLFRIKWDLRAFHWNALKMACSPIFGFFRDTFFFMTFTRSHGPSTMHMEYYGTLQRRLADLQAIIGIRPWKRGISLKMHFDGSHLLWGCKIIKNHKKMVRGN